MFDAAKPLDEMSKSVAAFVWWGKNATPIEQQWWMAWKTTLPDALFYEVYTHDEFDSMADFLIQRGFIMGTNGNGCANRMSCFWLEDGKTD